MPGELITFQKFNDIALANAIAAHFQEAGIGYQIEDNSGLFDPSFANNRFDSEIKLKIDSGDFPKANAILDAYYAKQLQDIDQDYYLLSFNDDELNDILHKPDEWGQFDYQLARKLLKDRGIEVDEENIRLFKENRVRELAQPERSETFWIFFGYLTALFGGFIGIIIGWVLAYLKKTLPDGSRVYVYALSNRRHGKRIIFFGVLGFVYWVIAKWQLFGLFD